MPAQSPRFAPCGTCFLSRLLPPPLQIVEAATARLRLRIIATRERERGARHKRGLENTVVLLQKPRSREAYKQSGGFGH